VLPSFGFSFNLGRYMVEKGVSAQKLITVFGDDSQLLYRPNVTSTTLGDAIRKGFLNEVSDNGLVLNSFFSSSQAGVVSPKPPNVSNKKCLR